VYLSGGFALKDTNGELAEIQGLVAVAARIVRDESPFLEKLT
jgi:hypothetical protein